MMLLIATAIAIAFGMALGLAFKVFMLLFVSAAIVGAGGAHVAAHSDLSLLVPVTVIVVCVQAGYLISGVAGHLMRRANPPGPGPAASSR